MIDEYQGLTDDDKFKRHYVCDMCGGTGIMEAGRYWDGKRYVEMLSATHDRQSCDMCDGAGRLGVVR